MRLVWSAESLDDLAAAHEYISRHNSVAAHAVVKRIVSLVEETLPVMPRIGRPGRVKGTRELVVPGTPFVVPYRVTPGVIEIVRVYHAARRWPSAFS